MKNAVEESRAKMGMEVWGWGPSYFQKIFLFAF